MSGPSTRAIGPLVERVDALTADANRGRSRMGPCEGRQSHARRTLPFALPLLETAGRPHRQSVENRPAGPAAVRFV